MRNALRRKTVPGGRVSTEQSFPPPIGGWNARDPLAHMKPDEAVSIQNWMPRTNYLEIRGGYTAYATGTTGNVKTLAAYNGLTGGTALYAYTASGIYDVSAAGAVGASKLARTNGKHQWVMFGDGTNNYLIACNGVDKPAYYDGTTWTAVDGASTPALTGVTTTNLIVPVVYKGRLWFIEKDSFNIWYLAAGAAGGALTKIDFSAEFKRGGYLVQAGVWTRDAGDGQDDVIVFLSSEGEASVYQGNNPAVAANWSKIGTYFIGRPLGRRCLAQFGGDLLILTESGLFPMSAALQTATIDARYALSFKIEPEFTQAARSYGSNFGWEIMVYPKQNAVIVNVPVTEDSTHYQFVMNTITKAWTKFTAWNWETFGLLGGQLYAGVSTTTKQAWTGVIDGSDAIEAYCKQAFNYFGTNNVKKFKMYRPILATNGNVSYLTGFDIDFADTGIAGTASYAGAAGSLWDTAVWDTGMWSDDATLIKTWTSPSGYPGFCAAPKLKISTNTTTVQWMANDVIYESGTIFS